MPSVGPAIPDELCMKVRGPKWLNNWVFVFCTIPVFWCYATGFGFQRYVMRDVLKIGIDDTVNRNLYSLAFSFLSLFNLLFRLLHNILFCFLNSYSRVCLAYVLFIIGELLFVLGQCLGWDISKPWALPLTGLSYAFFGAAIGSFESNMLTIARFYGRKASRLGVLGMPVGVNMLMIVWFLLMSVDAKIFCMLNARLTGCGLLLIGLLLWLIAVRRPTNEFFANLDRALPYREDYSPVGSSILEDEEEEKPAEPKAERPTESSPRYLLEAVRHWREWLRPVLHNACAMFFVNFGMYAVGPGFNQYIFENGADLWIHIHISYSVYQVVLGVLQFCGDFFGRQIFFHVPRIPPFFFSIASSIATMLTLLGIPELNWFCVLLSLLSNGALYCQTSDYIGRVIPPEWTVVALSFWLLCGDFGSYVCSLLMQPILNLLKDLWR